MVSLRKNLSVSNRAARVGRAGSVVGVLLTIVGLAGVPDDLRTWWEWLPAITHLLFLDLQYFGVAGLAMGIGLWMYGRRLEARIRRQERQDPIPASPNPRPLASEFAELGPYFYEIRGRFTDPTHQLIGDLTQLRTWLWSQYLYRPAPGAG